MLPDIDTQNVTVSQLDSQMQIVEALRKIKTEAQKKIEKILADVWDIEQTEPVIEAEAEQKV